MSPSRSFSSCFEREMSRATVEAPDVGFFRVSVAGPDRPTGIPEVDAVITDFGRRRPRVA